MGRLKDTEKIVKLIIIILSFLLLTSTGYAAGKVLVLEIDSTVNPAVSEYIKSAVDKATRDDFSAILIELDTPGGLLTSTREIVKTILNSPVPIIVYVYPPGAHAGSAGVFITLSAHIAAMAPGTNIGAAHPVTIGKGSQSQNEKELMKKVENDAVAFIESIARMRGRNVEWARNAVKKSITATAEEALKLHVIDVIASTPLELLEKINGREVEVRGNRVKLQTAGAKLIYFPMSTRYRIVNTLAHPEIAYILMLIGMLGIYLELSHPGLILPGVVGGISLIFAAIAFQFLPINTGGLLLILLAMVLIVLELFLPTMGVLAVGGVISFLLGSLLLFNRESGIYLDRSIIYTSTAILGLAILLVSYLVYKAHKRKIRTGFEGLIGEKGEAVSDISPEGGKVFVHGEYWDAYSDDPIEKGSEIEVVEVVGFKLKVRKSKGGIQ